MIELRTLGAVDLTGSRGQRVSSLLQQPKRVAVFAYLATSSPGAFQRRDKLLALFWPDADHERARHSLSQALYYVRRSLGKAVLDTAGGDVRIALGEVWCDVNEFSEALTQGQLEQAIGLYRGSFLDGFFIGDAPEFERWVDQERTRLQEDAAKAALTLAEREAHQGNHTGVLRWARRGMEISPYDERPLRLLMRMFGDMGDRANARLAYESFAQTLQDDLGIDPSPETVQLAAELSTPTAAPTPLAPTAVDVAESLPDHHDRPTAAPAPVGVRAAPPSRPWSARRVSRGLGAVVAAAAVLFAAAVVWRTSDAAAPAVSLDSVAILPFSYQGDARYGYLAEGLPELLGIGLSDLDNLHEVQSRLLLTWAPDRGTEALTRSDAMAAAREVGAGQYVVGSIIEAGGLFQIAATLYRVDGGTVTSFQDRIADESQIFGLVDDLARTIIASRYEGESDNLPQLAAVTTQSLPALKSYLAGERAFRAGQYQRAMESFDDAVTRDSTFALAWYRLSSVAGWLGGDDRKAIQPRAAAAAIRHSENLTRMDRLLIQAQQAFIDGHFASATSQLQSILSQQRENVQAWFQLGEVGYHYNAVLGLPISDAAEPFEEVLARDPDHVEALKHLAGIRASEGRFNDLDTLVRRMIAVEDDRPLLDYQALHAFAFDDARRQAGVLEKLREGDPAQVKKTASLVARMLRDPVKTQAVVEVWLQTARTPEAVVQAHVWLAHVYLARGKITAAHEELRKAAAHDAQGALEYRARFALEPFLSNSPDAIEESQGALMAWDRRAGSSLGGDDDDLGAVAHALGQPESYRGTYLAGLLAAQRGEREAALDQAELLERLTGASQQFGHALAQAVRAEVRRLAGDPDSALSLLETVEGEMVELSYYRLRESPILSFARERFLRTELLRKQGRHEEALRWYRSIGQQSLHELIYVAPSHLGQARIYEEIGDFESATAHYGRFLELWGDADPELQPLVHSGRAGLHRTSGERAAQLAS